MNWVFLRNRLLRVLTRPPELLYAVFQHGPLIAGCIVFGGLCLWVYVQMMPIVYEARAEIAVRAPDVPGAIPRRAIGRARDAENKSFIASQIELFQSDGVLSDLVYSLDEDETIASTDGSANSALGSLSQRLGDLKSSLQTGLRLDRPDAGVFRREAAFQERVRQFRQRSVVEATETNTAMLVAVYGANRERIKQELTAWIAAYERRAERLAGETVEDGAAELRSYFEEKIETAQRDVRDYVAQNADVEESDLEDVSYSSSQIQVQILELQRILAQPPTPGMGTDASGSPRFLIPQQDPDPMLAEYRRMRVQAEMDLFDLRLTRQESSDEVAAQKEKITSLDTKIKALEAKDAELLAEKEREFNQSAGIDPKDSADAQYAKYRDAVQTQIQALQLKHRTFARLKKKIERYEDLRQKEREAIRSLDEFEANAKLAEAGHGVAIQEYDQPSVSARPFRYHPLRMVGFGCASGLALGLFLAVVLEVLCSRVRFRHDLICDYDLPVVAVLPR